MVNSSVLFAIIGNDSVLEDAYDEDIFLTQNNLSALEINSVIEICNCSNVSYEGFQWPFMSVPILLVSLVVGSLIRSYHRSLAPQERNIVVMLDMSISYYLQANTIFILYLVHLMMLTRTIIIKTLI